MRVLSALLIMAGAAATAAGETPAVYHVAQDGNDAQDGTAEAPFASLDRALEAVREAGQPAEVCVHEGAYFLAAPLTLRAGDPPIAWRAAPDAHVTLTGALPVRDFGPVTDSAVLTRIPEDAREHVLEASLKAQGITDYGKMSARGFGRGGVAGLELFFRGEPMTLARWPNGDWTHIAKSPNKKLDDHFHYEGDRPERWAEAEDLWIHGYWTWDWADTYEKVARIDVENKRIYTEEPHGAYGYSPGHRFYALNLLEELDAPGEWFLDRAAGVLYFWPPQEVAPGDAVVSVGATLVKLEDAAGMRLEGFLLEGCRGTAIVVQGGADNVTAGCTIRNTGNAAVSISGGTKHGVLSCDIYNTGDGGIRLSGGDRTTLTPAGHFAENNHCWRYSRWCRTYRPAIGVDGVGQRVAHNCIHDAPHNGIQLGGNEHLIEFNELYDICKETGDVGAFYMGRDWTMRGTVIRHNFFHDIHGPYTHGAMAVYLDDAASGITIFGNVFCRASRAAFIGGGRDNIVDNNVFVACHPAVHIDSRGLGWAKKYIAKGGGWHMYDKLDAVNHDQPPYSARYPELAAILEDDPPVPKGNVITRNVFFGGDHFDLSPEGRKNSTIADNFTEGDPGFVDAEAMNFALREDSPVFGQIPGFKKIPVDQIGLKRDQYREVLP